MFGANFVIPAQICDELLWGQDKVYWHDNTPSAWKAKV